METDRSVNAPEALKGVMFIIGACGAASMGLSIAAEVTRVKTFELRSGQDESMFCVFPESPAMWYAMGAVLALLLAHVVSFVFGSFAWCPRPGGGSYSPTRGTVIVVLVAELVFSSAAMATLITAAVQNASLNELSAVGENGPECHTLEDGVFLTATVLTLFALVLVEAYYVLSMRAMHERWVQAYSASNLESFEMEDVGTMRMRTSGVAVDDVMEDDDILGDGPFLPSFGKKESMPDIESKEN